MLGGYSGDSVGFALVIGLVEPAILQDGDSLTKRLLELNDTGILLIEAFSFFDALDIGPQGLSQIDCGEHLHDCNDGPTVFG